MLTSSVGCWEQLALTMYHLFIPGLYILSGICIYATLIHLSAGLKRTFSLIHVVFGSITGIVALFTFCHISTLQATDISTMVISLKLSLFFALSSHILFFWFVALYTGKRPLGLLIFFTVLLTVMIGVNFQQPYSLQYAKITGLKALQLPWGEVVARPIGESSGWVYLTAIAILLSFGYILYALNDKSRSRNDWMMRLVVQLYGCCLILGILVRLGIINGVEPGSFSYVGVIIVMSILLNREREQRLITSENRFRSLVEQSPFSIQMLTPDGRSIQVNNAWKRLWGFKKEAIIHNHGYNIFQDAELANLGVMPQIEQGFAGIATEIPPQTYYLTNPTTGQSNPCWIRGHIYPIKDGESKLREVILMHEDVTERKRVEDAIHLIATGVVGKVGDHFFEQLVKSLANLFDADYTMIGVLDDCHQKHINTLALCIYGEIKPDISYNLADKPCANVIRQHTCVYPYDVQRLFPNDQLLVEMAIESYAGTPLYDAQGNALGIMVMLDSKPMERVALAQEILEIFAARASAEIQRLQDEAHIRRMAYHDYLTQLPNRAQLHQRLSEVLHRVRHSGDGGALLLIDLDHFKTINDALGHDIGDDVLRAIARRLEQVVEETAFVARLGGDEFVVLMTSNGSSRLAVEGEALQLAHRMLAKLSTPIVIGERSFSIGASIGVALFPDDGVAELDIMRHADMALYRAKNLGRGIVQLYLPSLQEAAINRLRLEEGLRQVITNNELELYFQPQVNANGEMLGAEVLLRWHHPELGDISPALFIPVAEETGLIHAIGSWVFEQSCRKLMLWLKQDVPFRGHLSINVCPWQFARPDFVEQVQQIIQNYGIDPHYLAIELTETALLHDVHETVKKLQSLRSLGLTIALDDFGTGYSSLAHLKDLPLDLIKIDQAFVKELNDHPKHCLVESIVMICQLMQLNVIAEGVETALQRDVLVQFGCENFQGYFFSRPLPEQDFLEWMGDHYGAMRSSF